MLRRKTAMASANDSLCKGDDAKATSSGPMTYLLLECTNFGTKAVPQLGAEQTNPSLVSGHEEGNLKAEDGTIPSVRVSGSHYEIGRGIGERFGEMIRSRFEKDEKLHKILVPFAATTEGEIAVDEIGKENRERYPRYWQELQGLADGSGVPFQQILLMNIWKELSLMLPPPDAFPTTNSSDKSSDAQNVPSTNSDSKAKEDGLQDSSNSRAHSTGPGRSSDVQDSNNRRIPDGSRQHVQKAAPLLGECGHSSRNRSEDERSLEAVQTDASQVVDASYVSDGGALSDEPDHCSDVLVCDERLSVVGHNEDAAASVKGHTYLVYATLPDGTSYTAFCYAGELCCPAFGWNSHGMAFSLNAVNPTVVRRGGVARNFVSRDLLEARSLDDAVQRVTRVPVAVGHNYNIMDFNQRRIVTVETASDGRTSILEIGAQPYFHSNHYLRLSVPQRTPLTTIRRLERAAQLRPPATADEVLAVLGDSADATCPIYMTGPLLVTLCTALFDLDRRIVTIYSGRPTTKDVLLEESI